MVMATCGGILHWCNCTPMARQRVRVEMAREETHGKLLHLLSTQRSGRRTSVITVRQNTQSNSCGTTEQQSPKVTSSSHTVAIVGKVGEGEGTGRRESSVVPEDESEV